MEKYFNIDEKGCSVRCKLYCTDILRVSGAVVFCHGFAGHKDNRAAQKLAERLQKKHPDIAVLVFNWPCHGDDARGKLTLDDCMLYLDLVIAYVRKRFHTDNLCACATSFGGYLVLKYITEHPNPFRKIALRCPAINMAEVMESGIMSHGQMDELRKGKPILVGFDRKIKITPDFLAELHASDVPERDYTSFSEDIVIAHGTKDEIVPFDVVRDFAERNAIDFLAVPSADHRFTDPQKMDAAIHYFLTHFQF